MKTTLIALAMTGAVLAGAPAAAEEMKITHDDLNLATAQGQKVLQQRIDAAARKVCGLSDIRTGTRVRSNEATDCYKQARAAANEHFAAIVANQKLGG